MPPTTTERLADYEQRYRKLAAQLATIGLIHSGSVTRRYTRCQTPGCKCHADPPQPHGPHSQWTAQNNGKTGTPRPTPPARQPPTAPPHPPGPTYQGPTKTTAKTAPRRLTENEAQLYQEWIA